MVTPVVVDVVTVLQSTVITGGGVMLEGGSVKVSVVPPVVTVVMIGPVVDSVLEIALEMPDVLVDWVLPVDVLLDVPPEDVLPVKLPVRLPVEVPVEGSEIELLVSELPVDEIVD